MGDMEEKEPYGSFYINGAVLIRPVNRLRPDKALVISDLFALSRQMSAAGEGVAFDTHHANRFHHIFPITEGFSRIGLAHNDVQP